MSVWVSHRISVTQRKGQNKLVNMNEIIEIKSVASKKLENSIFSF